MEKIRSEQESQPALPDLMEIMAMEVSADKWRLLEEALQEPLRQEHSALPEAWSPADLAHPDWRAVVGSRGRALWGPDGETLHLSRIDGTVYGREKFVRDDNGRLVEYREAAYDNSRDDPYATKNPRKSTAYVAKYLTETAAVDICRLAYAEYVRDEAVHHVATYWMPPPAGGWQGIGHIGTVKMWATREIGAKYVGGRLLSAHVLENRPVASPQPGVGPTFLLMRSVVGDFAGGRLAAVEAFQRLGLYQPQAKLTLTRGRDGRLIETIDRA